MTSTQPEYFRVGYSSPKIIIILIQSMLFATPHRQGIVWDFQKQ